MAAETLHLRCACGWETSGSEAEVTAAALEHGLRVHNMRASREDILAMATPAPGSASRVAPRAEQDSKPD
jgi:predicted small metal-binding protein